MYPPDYQDSASQLFLFITYPTQELTTNAIRNSTRWTCCNKYPRLDLFRISTTHPAALPRISGQRHLSQLLRTNRSDPLRSLSFGRRPAGPLSARRRAERDAPNREISVLPAVWRWCGRCAVKPSVRDVRWWPQVRRRRPRLRPRRRPGRCHEQRAGSGRSECSGVFWCSW